MDNKCAEHETFEGWCLVEKSSQIEKLAAALAKAQAAIEPATKDSTNPHFKSKYADLASVMRAVQKPLTDNGLSVLQFGRVRNGSHRELFTMLLHASGQWIGGALPLNPAKDDPQSLKAAITYMRRAGIESITGLATEDDDGNVSSYQSRALIHENAPVNMTYGNPSLSQIAAQRDTTKSQHPISDAQLNRLFTIAKKAGWDVNDINMYVRKALGVSPESIPRSMYDSVWKYVETSPPPGMIEDRGA